MAEIRLSGVNKVYPGGTHAVHDVDLHIADGEFMIMVGPSGCAKSTILRMIAGLEVPTSGTIEIGGRVVNDVAPKDRDIAMVFQSYALYPHMTVRENMAFGLKLRRMPQNEIDQRVAEAARILGLEQLLDRLPKAMSGGQRQRVAMGRAIVREPQAFLMDEPLSNLDAKLRVQMRTEIAKLHQRLQTTTVYVTHDQVEALTLGQRICILRKGVVQQVDTPFQVYTNPANIFVGGFIGSPGMNFMNGHIVLHDGICYLRLGEQHLPVPASVTSRLLATSDIHGGGVIVGIRPEHLTLSTSDDPAALPVQVELTEAMGAEVYAYFTTNVATPDLTALSDTQATADTFVARLGAGTDTRSGETIWLRPDLDEVHLFDPNSMLTMLTPAAESDVRARQSGAAIVLASSVHGHQPNVVAPPAYAPSPPAQPVIHLHQTFLQPETVTHGRIAEADPAAIASVFDGQAPAPFAVEPLAPPMAVGAQVFTTGPAAATASSHHPRPGAASVPHGARDFPGSRVRGNSGDAGMPRAGLRTPPAIPVDEPVRPEEALVEEPLIVSEPALPDPVAEVAAPEPPQRRVGFAPRVIGATPVAAPAATPAPVVAPTRVTLDATEVDAAIDGLEDAVQVEQLAPPAPTAPAAPAPAARPSAFRDALARVRARDQHVTLPAPPISTRVLPPPVSLTPRPDQHDGRAAEALAAELPSLRPPNLRISEPDPEPS
ncbi:MAG: transporter ATPase subunit [Thermoleophilia bacterium]|nr:transporter ATPase subunit [Thermoleophilia bacterium]